MPAPAPVFIQQAFAVSAAPADRNTIPSAPLTTQRASLQLGFPPLTMTPEAAGGKPMLGPDMNGVLYMLSTHTVYQQSGQPYMFSAAVAAAIGGYAVGTLLGSTNGQTLWYNNVAGNTNDPDANIPNSGWIATFSYGIAAVTALIGGVRTLTQNEAAKSIISLTGTLVSNQQIVLPNQIRRWMIVNATSGAFTLTVKTAAGTGIIVPQGGLSAPVEVWSDGTNIYNVVAPVNLPIDQSPTPLTIPQRNNDGTLLAVNYFQTGPIELATPGLDAVYCSAGDGYHRRVAVDRFQEILDVGEFGGVCSNVQITASAVNQHRAVILNDSNLTGTPTAPTAPPGTVTNQVATCEFASPVGVLAQLGSQPWPGGLIIKWGRVNLIPSGATGVPFNAPFPNEVFVVLITAQNTGGNAQAADAVTNKTAAGFTINNASNVARTFDWIALGR